MVKIPHQSIRIVSQSKREESKESANENPNAFADFSVEICLAHYHNWRVDKESGEASKLEIN